MSEHKDVIERYELGAKLIEEAVQSVPRELLDKAPAPGKWSIREQLIHLADAEVAFSWRLRIVAAADGAKISAFDQDEWVANLGYDKRTADEALTTFVALRNANGALLRALPDEAWSHKGVHEERGPLTMDGLLASFSSHAESHAKSISDAKGKLAQSA